MHRLLHGLLLKYTISPLPVVLVVIKSPNKFTFNSVLVTLLESSDYTNGPYLFSQTEIKFKSLNLMSICNKPMVVKPAKNVSLLLIWILNPKFALMQVVLQLIPNQYMLLVIPFI